MHCRSSDRACGSYGPFRFNSHCFSLKSFSMGSGWSFFRRNDCTSLRAGWSQDYLLKYTFPFSVWAMRSRKEIKFASPPHVPRSRSHAHSSRSIVCYLLWRTDTYITPPECIAYANLPNILFRYFASLVISATFVRLVFDFYQIVKSRNPFQLGRSSLDIYVMHIYLVKILATINHPLKGSLWFTFLVSPCGVDSLLACYQGDNTSGHPLARTLPSRADSEPPQSTQCASREHHPTELA